MDWIPGELVDSLRRGDTVPAALRDHWVRDGGARDAGDFRGSQEAGVAVGPSGEREEGETEGGSSCLRARDCVREGFQALMGLALSLRPRRGFCFVSGQG